MKEKRAVIIGAGVGGMAASIELASRGFLVTVIERAEVPGGKLREAECGGVRIDAGPTVFTMREVFDDLFDRAGASLGDYLELRPANVLARHAWETGGRLDLLADVNESADAIANFAGAAEAKGFLAFCREARDIYRILESPFIKAQKPNLAQLIWRMGPHRLADQLRINPYQTLWGAVSRHFRDPRLRQLFARYSTYCGSSPFSAPATLMLVAHVEQRGVWLVDGGMYRIAKALETLATRLGVTFRYHAEATQILKQDGRTSGVLLTGGERLAADAVVVNADISAVTNFALGQEAAHAIRPSSTRSRSLSALTWAMFARVTDFPLARHTVFFPSAPYRLEFESIFKRGALPEKPAVYVCAQDRDCGGISQTAGEERLLCIVNAPPETGLNRLTQREIEECETKAFGMTERCGLRLQPASQTAVRTAPSDFEAMFPQTGGAIYGRSSHGWMASFYRQGARSRMPGLYFAGGSTHPGPGVPMAALSGRMAAEAIATDFASMKLFHRVVMPGGMPMPLAQTGALD